MRFSAWPRAQYTVASMLGITVRQRSDDVADIDASAQHVILVAGAGLDPGHDPPLLVPRFGCVTRLGKAAQNCGLALGPAHPDIMAGTLNKAVEHDIAGEPEYVIDIVVFAPRHRLFAAVMAVAADGDAGVGPVAADAPDQAAEKLTNLHTRRRLARA